MKNRFLFVFMLLLFGMGTMVAQTPEKYWTLETYPGYWASGNMTATFLIYVDGEMLDDPNIELGAFINGMLVANGSMPSDYTPPRPYPEYDMVLNGFSNEDSEDANGNMIDFQLYDHSTGEILPYYAPQQVKFFLDWVASQPGHPIILNFFTGETQWEKVTANDLQVGDLVIITGSETDVALNQNQAGNYRKGHAIERVGNTITWLPADPDEEEFDPQFVLIHQYNSYNSTSTDVQLFVSTGYLYASSNTADQLRTFRNELANDFEEPNSLWSINVDEDGIASLVAQGPNSHNVMQLNPSNERFLCFTSNSKEDLNLYRLTLYTAPTTFDVTVTATEGGTAIGGQEDVEAGTEITVTATPIDCYNFAGWMVNDEIVSTEAEYTFTVDADIALVATFEKVEFEVTFAAEPADVVSISNDPITVECGDFVNEPVYTIDDDCYVFDKWTVNGEEIDLATYAITANVDIIANFVKQTFEATFVAEPADVIDMTEAIATVECGDFAPDPEFTITDDCYEFLNWTVNGEEIDLATYAIEDDVTITANYAKKEFEVTFVAEPADVATLPAEAATVECGAFATAPEYTITDECYEFVNWTVNGDEIDLAAYAIEGDVTITANFAKKAFEVTFVAEPADVATMPAEAATVECGAFATAPEYTITDECYEFVNWTVNGDEIDLAAYAIEGDVTITANFAKKEFEVTFAAEPADVATMPAEAATVECGAFATAPEYTITDECYEFVNWTVNGDEIDLATYAITADVTITANFAKKAFEVTFVAEPADVATMPAEAANVECGAFATAPEYTITDECYEFVNWTVNGDEIDLATYAITADVTITANFVKKVIDVTYTSEPADVATMPAAAQIECGELANPTYENLDECYTFVNWTVNDEEIDPTTYVVSEAVEIVAHFEINKYNVTYTANPAEAATMPEAEEVDCGQTVNPTYTIAEGYEFENWTVGGAVIELPYEITAETELVANFTQLEYNVNITVNPAESGTAIINEAGPYHYGDVITLNAEPANGYQFVNFTIGTEEITSPYTVTGDAEIVANFIEETVTLFTITATAEPAEGGTVSGAGTYPENESVTLTATANTGYNFVGWELNEEIVSTDAEYNITVTENAAYIAVFEIQTFEIVVTDGEGGTHTMNGTGTYNYGDEVTITAVPNEGYRFVSFIVGDAIITENPYVFNATENLTIQVNFELIPMYAVTIAANPAEAATFNMENGEVEENTEITVTATMAEGYNFLNWTVNGEVQDETGLSLTVTVTEAMDIVANFELIPEIVYYMVTIAANPAEAATFNMENGEVEENTEITVTATMAEGYSFLNWTVNGEVQDETGLSLTVTVTENMDIVANFELIPVIVNYMVTIAANPAEAATFNMENGEVEENTEITVTATMAEGYNFLNWTVNGEVQEETELTLTITVTEDMDIVANFELIPMYTVTIAANPAEAATFNMEDGEVEENTEITVTATMAEGYNFLNWTVNGEVQEETGLTLTLTVTEDVDIVANFEEIPPTEYIVTLLCSPVAGGTTEGSGTYVEGTMVTINAIVNEGYEFVNWTMNTDVVSTDAEYTFEITSDITLVANFYLIPVINYYTVNFEVNPEEAGTVDQESGEYEEGSEVTVTATAAEGYEFINWTVNGTETEGEENVLTFTVTEEMTVVANFELIPVIVEYNIFIDEIENGTVSAPATSPAGETITVIVTPNPMYVLTSLYYYTTDPEETTDIDINTKQFVMPEADVTIGAEFMLVTGKGDVNLDGEVNILDVLTALNYILEKNPQPFDFDQADMNEDGVIDISDVMAINAMILGLKADCEGDYAVYQVIDNKLYIDANMALAGYQFRLTAEPTVIDMPGFATAGNWSNGEYIFVIYNLSGEKASGLYAILDLGDANVNNVVMATKEGCQVRGVEGTVSVNSFDESAYTVFPVPANTNVRVAGPGLNQVEVYNTMGQRVMVVNDINADETNINVMSLTPGSYLFRIITTNGMTTKNVIVVR